MMPPVTDASIAVLNHPKEADEISWTWDVSGAYLTLGIRCKGFGDMKSVGNDPAGDGYDDCDYKRRIQAFKLGTITHTFCYAPSTELGGERGDKRKFNPSGRWKTADFSW